MTEELEQAERCCGNCLFWKILQGQNQNEQPVWGVCRFMRTGTRKGSPFHPFAQYIRPLPEYMETTSTFSCKLFNPSFDALRAAHEAQDAERK
jgi:hypothetical protein